MFLTRCLVSCGLGCLKVKGSKVPTCSKRSDIARDRGLLALALYRSAEASQAGSVSQGSVSLGLFRVRCTQTHFGMVNQSRSEKAEARSLNASHIGLEKRKHVLPCIILVSWASFLQIGVQKQLSLIATFVLCTRSCQSAHTGDFLDQATPTHDFALVSECLCVFHCFA